MISITCKDLENHDIQLIYQYNHITNFVWSVNDSIEPDHIWVAELPHNGCLFEQFVPALFILTAKRLNSHLDAFLGRAHPLSFVDHPKLPTAQLLLKGDALSLHLIGVPVVPTHLSLEPTHSGNWCPELGFVQFIMTSGQSKWLHGGRGEHVLVLLQVLVQVTCFNWWLNILGYPCRCCSIHGHHFVLLVDCQVKFLDLSVERKSQGKMLLQMVQIPKVRRGA